MLVDASVAAVFLRVCVARAGLQLLQRQTDDVDEGLRLVGE